MSISGFPTILIVDDNPVNLASLRILLGKKDSYHIIEATGGQETLDQVKANPGVDLILLDVILPDMSGIEVCERLKKDSLTEHIPIVLISAVACDDDSIAEGLAVGADGYLTKPIDNTALQAWLKSTLRISALQNALADRGVKAPVDDKSLLNTFSKLSHTVNHPLQSLLALSDLLLMDLSGNTDATASLYEIQNRADQIARIVAEASQQAKVRLNALEKERET